MSLDSSEEDGVEQVLWGAVTSVDEALLKVTGAAEDGQEDFLKQNFETLNQSCSTGMKPNTNFKWIFGHFGSVWIRR